MDKKDVKKAAKKVWHFLWHEDSLASWLVCLLLAFLIVRFMIFPLLSFALATPLPLVVIESGSMHHPGDFIGNLFASEENFDLWWKEKGEWYSDRGINREEVMEWTYRTGLEKGDIIVVNGRAKLKVGDIIVFNANEESSAPHPIIHRVVRARTSDEEGRIYSTKGDNNFYQFEEGNNPQQIDEVNIKEGQVLGKAVLRIPKLGWAKLFFVEIYKKIVYRA